MKASRFSLITLFLSIFSLACLSGCGPDLCNCLDEADKEKPNQELLEKCRAQFTQMDQSEIDAAVKKCGR